MLAFTWLLSGRIIRPDNFLLSGLSGIRPDGKIHYPVHPYIPTIRARMHMDDSHGVVPLGVVTRLHQYLPPESTNIFSTRLLRFMQFPCSEVMSVTLPKLFKLMSNKNRISDNHEMQSFMKLNVPAIMTHDHQSFAAIESEQYAVEHETQF